jgi:hypothetical protein
MSTNVACAQAQALMMELSMALPADEFLLSADEEALLVQHLAACPDCRAYQNAMQQLTASLKSLETVEVPAGLADRIMQTVEAQAQTSDLQARLPQKKRFGLFMSIAATVLLLVLAFPILKTEIQTDTNLVAVSAQGPKTSEVNRPDAAPMGATSGMQPAMQAEASERTTVSGIDTSQIASARSKTDPTLLDELAFAGGQFDADGPGSDPVGNLVGF